MMALSIRPVWAWAIIHAGKDVENRPRPCQFRGRFLVHASLDATREDFEKAIEMLAAEADPGMLPCEDEFAVGGIIGSVELSDVTPASGSRWYEPGAFAWYLRNPRPLPFFPCRGYRNWFHVPDDLVPVSHRT